uniref:Uncharacterized protein n=1 Tax=Oryza barthii TaxID=65489 RepID=A0A0D3G0I3_9ORYZ
MLSSDLTYYLRFAFPMRTTSTEGRLLNQMLGCSGLSFRSLGRIPLAPLPHRRLDPRRWAVAGEVPSR